MPGLRSLIARRRCSLPVPETAVHYSDKKLNKESDSSLHYSVPLRRKSVLDSIYLNNCNEKITQDCIINTKDSEFSNENYERLSHISAREAEYKNDNPIQDSVNNMCLHNDSDVNNDISVPNSTKLVLNMNLVPELSDSSSNISEMSDHWHKNQKISIDNAKELVEEISNYNKLENSCSDLNSNEDFIDIDSKKINESSILKLMEPDSFKINEQSKKVEDSEPSPQNFTSITSSSLSLHVQYIDDEADEHYGHDFDQLSTSENDLIKHKQNDIPVVSSFPFIVDEKIDKVCKDKLPVNAIYTNDDTNCNNAITEQENVLCSKTDTNNSCNVYDKMNTCLNTKMEEVNNSKVLLSAHFISPTKINDISDAPIFTNCSITDETHEDSDSGREDEVASNGFMTVLSTSAQIQVPNNEDTFNANNSSNYLSSDTITLQDRSSYSTIIESNQVSTNDAIVADHNLIIRETSEFICDTNEVNPEIDKVKNSYDAEINDSSNLTSIKKDDSMNKNLENLLVFRNSDVSSTNLSTDFSSNLNKKSLKEYIDNVELKDNFVQHLNSNVSDSLSIEKYYAAKSCHVVLERCHSSEQLNYLIRPKKQKLMCDCKNKCFCDRDSGKYQHSCSVILYDIFPNLSTVLKPCPQCSYLYKIENDAFVDVSTNTISFRCENCNWLVVRQLISHQM